MKTNSKAAAKAAPSQQIVSQNPIGRGPLAPGIIGGRALTSLWSNVVIGCYRTADLTEDEVLGMIIGGKPVTRVPQCLRREAPLSSLQETP